MNDELVLRANKVKAAVEVGKESFIATQREYEVTKRTLTETLADLQEKYGIDSYAALQREVEALAAKIATDLTQIEALLASASLPVVGDVHEV
jgi:hypothetical protein